MCHLFVKSLIPFPRRKPHALTTSQIKVPALDVVAWELSVNTNFGGDTSIQSIAKEMVL